MNTTGWFVSVALKLSFLGDSMLKTLYCIILGVVCIGLSVHQLLTGEALTASILVFCGGFLIATAGE